jgi:AbiJ-like protein
VLHQHVWDTRGFRWAGHGVPGEIRQFSRDLWFRYFKRSFSDIPVGPDSIIQFLENYFFSCAWNEAYDFLEAVIEIVTLPALIRGLNNVLERELSGYRIVEHRFVPVTAPEELAALDEALQDDRFASVGNHLRSALALLSDRKNPDYRNSIKESISAVEAMAKVLSGKDKATLDDALRTLEKNGRLHPALRQGFTALYGYTSDADGIRHAMLQEPNLSPADAKFFLLSCTSFTNYLKSQI